MQLFFYQTPIGKLGIQENNGKINQIYFENEAVNPTAVLEETAVLNEAGKQLKEYFKGERKEFSLPLDYGNPPPFTKKVWEVLKGIPYGQVISYQEAARRAGSEKAARAAGNACNKNPIAIVIPCHRVVGSNGSLTGFGGGLWAKQQLLELERGMGELFG